MCCSPRWEITSEIPLKPIRYSTFSQHVPNGKWKRLSILKVALRAYDVQAIDTLIGDILPPATLMTTQTDRKLREEQRKTYEVQQMAQTQRQQLVRETAIADIQQDLVKSEQGVKIAELKANARVKESTGEAEAIRVTGNAKAEAYKAGVDALGGQVILHCNSCRLSAIATCALSPMWRLVETAAVVA
jgi:uncharacterized membrane protein YqiK